MRPIQINPFLFKRIQIGRSFLSKRFRSSCDARL